MAGRIQDRRRCGERQPAPLGPAEEAEERAGHPGRAGDVDVQQPPPLLVRKGLDGSEELHADV